MKIPENLQTNFTIEFPWKVSLPTLSPFNLHTNHSGNHIYHVFSIKNSGIKNHVIFPFCGENTSFQCKQDTLVIVSDSRSNSDWKDKKRAKQVSGFSDENIFLVSLFFSFEIEV